MGEKLVVGPINKGLRTDRLPFVIDNDSFPVLINAYQWRGRVKRKRGTQLLCQLQRWIGTTDGLGNLTVTIAPAPASGLSTFIVGTNIFTDPGTGFTVTLLSNGPGTGTLTSGGVLTISVASNPNTAVIYVPHLPVMGLEELRLNPNLAPQTLAFDTKFSYLISQNFPFPSHDVSYYKNPPTGTYTNYVAKSTWTPLNWNGLVYQQFWTTNFAGALWATNGVKVPFNITNIGMQYVFITAISTSAGPPPTATITTSVPHGLVIGDFVFINEVQGLVGINFQTGYVTTVGSPTQITVTFPNATFSGAYSTGGIVQYLTNRFDKTIDCIRWFDGDPTNGQIPPTFNTPNGWVNYCPPLSQGVFSIGGLSRAQYYLVGAKMIIPFKDRLVFLGPVIQTSAAGSQVYLQDTIIYSQVGTPYYTCSYTNSPSSSADTPTSATITFNPILVPTNQGATAPAMFEDQVGFGGFITAGLSEAITTAGSNEDGLIIGFSNKTQTRLLSTGNDVTPFEFFVVNAELGSASTFSSIVMDQGVITRGNRGYVISSQTGTQRIDLEILNQVFRINLDNNGNESFTAQRDFQNEWIYFTYSGNENEWIYPDETLLYNYRDNSYAIFYESYTTYGQFTKTSGETWADLNYFTWDSWQTPWNETESVLFQPIVIAGNQQGFVLVRDTNTEEATSLSIQNIGNPSANIITCPNHNLNNNDFIYITGCTGTIASAINGKIFQIANATTNTFQINPNPGSGSYTGGGYIIRLYRPFIQTKQFPVSWELARKTRIGAQRYLLTTTDNAQITVDIYLSQDAANEYNDGPITPSPGVVNGSLIYSQIVYTCPESTNLGLTPANTNLQMLAFPGSGTSPSAQIWHRMNTSLIGDTVQLAFTLSDDQMKDTTLTNQTSEIELHAFILDVSPSMELA